MAVAGLAAELGVKPASALATASAGQGTGRVLPVGSQLQGLLPDGLVRGTTVAVTAAGSGATSLLLGLLAEPTRQGSWCAVVGVPRLSLAAAKSLGVALEQLEVGGFADSWPLRSGNPHQVNGPARSSARVRGVPGGRSSRRTGTAAVRGRRG
jgi:hypothetical protein